MYPLSRNEREEVQQFIQDHLRKGYIRPSKSPQTSPVFFVGKKDGGKHMVMDYRRLNKQTVRNGHLSKSGRQIPTLSQSRQRELVRVPAGFEYTTYTYSTWSVHYFPTVIM